MYCFNHDVTAKSICVSCGMGLCSDCMQHSRNGRICCSETCKSNLEKSEALIEKISSKAKASSMAGAYAGYLMGAFCALFAMIEEHPDLSLFLGGMSVVMFAMGVFYHRSARAKEGTHRAS